MSFWQPSKARLPRTLGSNSAPGTHSKHDMMPRNVAFGSKLIKFECRCLGMLPSDQRVRAQAPCRTRGCAPRHPCRTSRCEGGALPALEGAPRCPFRTPGRARAPFSAPKGALKGCFPHPGCFVPIEKKKIDSCAPQGAARRLFPHPRVL